MLYLKKILDFGSRFIEYRMGIIGAFVMASIVFCINYFSVYELGGAFTAALKQGGYTFLLGGSLMKSCEFIAVTFKRQTLAIVAAVLIPSVFTLVLTLTMHQMKGTPKPFASTLPTLIIIPATAVWGYRKRMEFKRSSTNKEIR